MNREMLSPGAEEAMKNEGLSAAQAYGESGGDRPVDPTLPDETGLSPEDRAAIEAQAAQQANNALPEEESFMENRG